MLRLTAELGAICFAILRWGEASGDARNYSQICSDVPALWLREGGDHAHRRMPVLLL